MVRHVSGNIHQGAMQFSPFNGVQCTPVALIALLAFTSCNIFDQTISPFFLDRIIANGTNLYSNIRPAGANNVYLQHRDLPLILPDGTSISYDFDQFYGQVGLDLQINRDAGESSFDDALYQALVLETSHIITFNNVTVALHCDRERNQFAIFDSHQRDDLGRPSDIGSSILLRYNDINEMLMYIHSTYFGARFEITPVNFVRNIQTSYHNHTYICHKAKKRKTNSSKRKFCNNANISNQLVSNDENVEYNNLDQDFLNDLTEVGLHVEIETQPIDLFNYQDHAADYEHYIRQKPEYFCDCCLRFLFNDQTWTLHKSTDVFEQLQLKKENIVCNTCYHQIIKNNMPCLSYTFNSLDNGKIPLVLKQLSSTEKKLVALIQIFMTIVVLPGGQFAEKGLIFNLPTEIQSICHQLPSSSNIEDIMAVNFMHNNNVELAKHYRFNVSPYRLSVALEWLKTNNPLYKDIELGPTITTGNICDDNIDDFDGLEHCSMTPVNSNVPNVSINSILGQIDVPSTAKSPISIYEMDFGEEMAFPWLFPYGINGIKTLREIKLNPSMYLKGRFYSNNSMFRKDMTYLLHTAISYNISLMKQQVSIQMKTKKSEPHGNVLVTAQDLRSSNTDSFVSENSYMFMKSIRGTVAYFKNSLYNLLAMFKCLGPPTIFMTLSADDCHWPELGMSLENLGYEEAKTKMSFSASMRKDPFMTAIHFERRFNALIKKVICSNMAPLGEVQDYFARVEFQKRGSPHVHMFFWINMPRIIDNTNKEIFLTYIRDHIITSIPNAEDDSKMNSLVTKLQTHSHSSYCTNGYRRTCRFGFPHAECKETHILEKVDVAKLKKGKFYETKRTKEASMINAYNPIILKHWRANMDLQLVCNAQGAAYYVCSYICKSEPDELRNALGQLIHSLFKNNPNLTKTQRLLKIGYCVLRHRQVSAQEAAYRLGNMKLIHCSRSTVYINARFVDKRFRMLKPKKEIAAMSNESTDIFLPNIMDYYLYRPTLLEKCSMYNFASSYEKCQCPKTNMGNEKIYIARYDIWMRKKNKHSVIRFPNFPILSEEYFYCLLVLLLPHRAEMELLTPCSSWKNAYLNKKDFFDENINLKFISFTEEVENLMRKNNLAEKELSSLNNESDARDTLSKVLPSVSNTTVNDLPEDINQMQYIDDHSQPNIQVDDVHLQSLECCIMSLTDYNNNLQLMTASQNEAFVWIQNELKKNEPVYTFITGGAGVGKSFLTKMLIAYLQLFKSYVFGESPVIVAAPTGTAANNIEGFTLHSVFSIPVMDFLQYEPLSGYRLSIMRQQFLNINSVIIDEISMVSSEMLTFISRRLSEIKDNARPFGGVNIIAIGDFFQLKPVKGNFAFTNTILWNLFTPLFLTENVRQRGDTFYASLLNRARVGLLTSRDISILKKRTMTNKENDFDNALHIFPTRQQVNDYNLKCQLALKCETTTISVQHYFGSADPNPTGDVPNELLPTDSLTGGLPDILILSVGTRIMLTRNVCTQKGLVNGAMGYVVEVEKDDNAIKYICIQFDNKKIAQAFCNNAANEVRIEKVKHLFSINGRSVVRYQFPLIPCWGCTIHKVQGLSLSKAVIDIGSTICTNGMSYIALSRVTQLEGLLIIAFDPTKVQPFDAVLEEYNRMRNLQ